MIEAHSIAYFSTATSISIVLVIVTVIAIATVIVWYSRMGLACAMYDHSMYVLCTCAVTHACKQVSCTVLHSSVFCHTILYFEMLPYDAKTYKAIQCNEGV